nr:hypothetical protein [Mycolicibacterium neoaurum]
MPAPSDDRPDAACCGRSTARPRVRRPRCPRHHESGQTVVDGRTRAASGWSPAWWPSVGGRTVLPSIELPTPGTAVFRFGLLRCGAAPARSSMDSVPKPKRSLEFLYPAREVMRSLLARERSSSDLKAPAKSTGTCPHLDGTIGIPRRPTHRRPPRLPKATSPRPPCPRIDAPTHDGDRDAPATAAACAR